MDENEVISVSKNAIHIQIIKRQSCRNGNCQRTKELDLLINILSKILDDEQKSNRQIQYAKMTALEIRECFVQEDFPRSTFVQY